MNPAKAAQEERKVYEALEKLGEDRLSFGSPENKKNKDLWPNMLVLTAMQSLYEASGDERVIPFLTNYFRFQSNLPVVDLLPESWQKLRGGENLESVYWLCQLSAHPAGNQLEFLRGEGERA